MEIVIYSISFWLEHIKYLILYKFVLKIPSRNNKWAWVTMFIGSIVMSLTYNFTGYGGKIVVYLILLFTQSFFYLCEKNSKKIVLILWSFCTISCLTNIGEGCVLTIQHGFDIYKNEQINDLLTEILTIIVLIIMYRILNERFNYKKMPIKYYILFIVILVANLLVLTEFVYIIEFSKMLDKNVIVAITYTAISIGVYVQLILIMYLSITKDVYKEKDELNKQYLKAEEEHYVYLEKREQDTKKFRHDIKNHLDVLANLCKLGDMHQIEKYIESINGHINMVGKRISVNHNIADAIINQYIDICEKEEIKIDVTGNFPAECFVEPYDICTMISNMLKNARTAVQISNEKWINYIIKYNEETNDILIKMYNTYDGTVDFLSTSKEDKSNHGYGLTNIREMVGRYNGFFEIAEKEGVVETRLNLKNQPLAQKINHWNKKY